MHVILGASGHVGSALTNQLLMKNEEVLVITHSPEKQKEWQDKGAKTVLADVNQSEKLHKIFKRANRIFLLNPPAPVSGDNVTEEKRSVRSILTALKGIEIEKVVGESTYGSQAGEGIGDLGILHEMEVGLNELALPNSIIRAAYYMSNWDNFLPMARKEGKIQSFYPENFKLPMVAPEDIGMFASKLMREDARFTGVHYFEGPERYSAKDVARAFSRALGRSVAVEVIPTKDWIPYLLRMGYSEIAAKSMAEMSRLTLEKFGEKPLKIERGTITIDDYIEGLVRQQAD